MIYLVIPEVSLHFQCFNPYLVGLLLPNGFKVTDMIGNNSSLVILINDAMYSHFYPTFQLPTAPLYWRQCAFTLQV